MKEKMLAQRLIELRAEKGISQATLAKACKISQSCVAMLEKEKNEASASTVQKIAEYFNVTTDYLLGRTDDLGAPVPASAPQYSAEEQKLIEDYRGLSQPLKDMLQSLIKTWQGESTESTQRRKNR